MRRLRRTKIVATLGPASGERGMIARLFEAGADVFRINMSHTSHDRMRELVDAIRDVERQHGRPVGILVDLQGPKLRVGSFAGGSVMLDNGATFTLDTDPKPGDATRVQLPHPEIFEGIAGRPHSAARRRQDPPGGDRSRAGRRSSPASRSAASCPTARA